MARKLRVQYPGAVYHVMNRGDRREDIFQSDHDRRLFLDTLGQTCEKTDWQERKTVACENTLFRPIPFQHIQRIRPQP
jgi:REP element-mobilizing transposase RayT